MPDKENKNTFPDKDKILEYLKGGLTSSERHWIERLILENDFFREVVEGLESEHPDLIQEDLIDLTHAIESRSSFTDRSGFNVYKLAATVSLLILASAIIYFVINIIIHPGTNEQVSLNQSAATDSLKKEIEAIPKVSEKMELTTQEPEDTPIQLEKQAEPLQKIKLESHADRIEGLVDSIELKDKNQFVTAEDYQEDVSVGVLTQISDEERVNTIEIEITNDQAEMTPISEISDQITGIEMPEDKKIQKKERSGRAVPAIASKIDPIEYRPEPVIGFDSYYKYLIDSLQYPKHALDQQIEGIVGIRFIIGKDSIPKNITCTQSIGFGCDEEAIRLIREGSKWRPKAVDGKIVEAEVSLNVEFFISKKR